MISVSTTTSLSITCSGALTATSPSMISADRRSRLQPNGPALGRSRADYPHAGRRLPHGHPVRAPPLRRGSPQSGLSLVLPARTGWQSSRSLDVLEEPTRPLSRERHAAPPFRERGAALYRRGLG